MYFYSNIIFFRCERFVIHCEVSTVVMTREECCRTFFNPKPIFTTLGTCFTSKAEVFTKYGGMQSKIMIYLEVDQRFIPRKKNKQQELTFLINLI